MANPVAPHTFTKEQLRGLYRSLSLQHVTTESGTPMLAHVPASADAAYDGGVEVISTRDYRVFFNPETDEVNVQVRLADTETAHLVWFHAVAYTAK